MNPYKSPESDLEVRGKKVDAPKSIVAVYYLIGLSFLIFLLAELFGTTGSEDVIYDEYYYLLIVFAILMWAAVLLWITDSVRNRKDNPKYLFLVLAFVVSGVGIYDPLGPYSLYAGLGESACFLFAYYLLNRSTSIAWFE